MHRTARRIFRRLGWILAGIVGAGFAACYGGILPERYAINGPIAQVLWGRQIDPPAANRVGDVLSVPPGYEIELYATDVPVARMLRFSSTGDLLVSLPRVGAVALLERDRDGDGAADAKRILVSGLRRPHGLDFHGRWLYVAETDSVGRIAFDPDTGLVSGDYERVVTGLPGGGNHWSRTLRFGPDGWMYVAIGSSCNVCIEGDPRRAAIVRYRPDGSGEELYATGLRNAVGIDWRPADGALYATDNGRDFLGDDFPPCELNRVEAGAFYGWPFANGDRDPDPDLGSGRDAEIEDSLTPVHDFRAHNAPLGIAFVEHPALPSLSGSALVALHGSWNRSTKDGYKVVSLHWSAAGEIEERDFVTGFERDERVFGRPVDVAIGPEGGIYISDDYAGVIYRVRRSSERRDASENQRHSRR